MSEKNSGVFVVGRVLDVEHKSGNQGTDKSYSFHIVSMLTGKTVCEVKWDARNIGDGPLPKEGDELHVAVELGVYAGRQQINAKRLVAAPGVGVRAAS